jgi:hypothetical protein
MQEIKTDVPSRCPSRIESIKMYKNIQKIEEENMW